MPVAEEDQRGVPVTVASALPRSLGEALHLGLRQIASARLLPSDFPLYVLRGLPEFHHLSHVSLPVLSRIRAFSGEFRQPSIRCFKDRVGRRWSASTAR